MTTTYKDVQDICDVAKKYYKDRGMPMAAKLQRPLARLPTAYKVPTGYIVLITWGALKTGIITIGQDRAICVMF